MSESQSVLMFQTSSMSEKLCLKWNDFQENVNAAFGNLREDNEFADVTNSSYGLIFVKIRALFWRKYGQNHKNTGVIRAISHKCPYIQARPYLYGRLGHTVSGQK